MDQMKSREMPRGRVLRDTEDDELFPSPHRPAPGKLGASDVRGYAGDRGSLDSFPGKLTWGALGRDQHPAGVLAWAQSARVDRRAEIADDVDGGTLATAFSFLDRGSGGAALPAPLVARLSRELGVDLSRVRVHTDDRAARAAATIHARAFTLGEDIYFSAGAYDPGSESGIRLIAHEVAHVAQNYRGTAPTSAGVSQPGDRHEREAERFAERFVSLRPTAETRAVLDDIDAFRHRVVDALVPAVRSFVELAPRTPARDRLVASLPAPARTEHAHRDKDDGTGIEDRWKHFETNHAKAEVAGDLRTTDARKKARFGIKDGNQVTRVYRKTSAEPFSLQDYLALVRPVYKGDWSGDLQKLYSEHGSAIRLSRVGDKGAHTYVWTEGPPAYADVVDDLKAVSRKAPDPNLQWAFYSKAIYELQDKHDILKDEFDGKVKVFGVDAQLDPDAKPGGGKSVREADEFRRLLVEAIATHKRYKMNKQGEWTNFYNDICKSALFRSNPGFTGNCFETLVGNTIGKLEDDRPIFEDEDIGRETRDGTLGGVRKGDHHRLISQGKNIVVECKAVTSDTPSPENLEQAKDYYKIVKRGIIGYVAKKVDAKGEEELIKPNKYSHVTYVFPVQKIAAGWYPALLTAFNEEDKLLSTVPSHDGKSISVLLQANPKFNVALDGPGPHYHLDNPPIFHPGMKIRDLDITLAKPGVPRIAKGTMHADVDLGGAVKAQNQKTEIKPAEDAPGAVNGNITNELGKGATSKLDKLLGKIKPSVVLTDNGVRGTLTLEQGGKIAPGIAIDHGEITATYDSGRLTATGGVHIVHQKGKFDVDLKVGWDGHEWTFNATTTVHAGLVDGLSEFSLTVDYQHGAWRIGAPEASYQRKIGGVELTGKVKDLVIDPHHGEVDADLFVTADLGAFGKAGADARIEHGKLKSASFSYDTPELVFPRRSTGKPPVFTGSVGGTLRYDDGHLSGKIRGQANLSLPGLKALSDTGEVGLAVDAQVDRDGKFSGAIESKTALTFGKHFRIPHLRAQLNPDGDAEAHFELQVAGLKNVSDARLAAAIDKNGFRIEGGGITIAIGDKDKDRMWGSVSAYYHEGDGLVIGGLVNVKIKDGMIGTGWLNYSTKKGTGDAGVKVDRIPILDVTGETRKLVDFDRQIPVFSFWGITLFIDLRFVLEFLYGFKLGLTPSVQVNGIDLHDLSFQEAIATIEVDGDLSAALKAAPGVGLGLALFHPDLLSGSVGLDFPVTAGAHLNPKTTLQATYDKDGGLRGGASLGLSLNFGIDAAVEARARANVLLGAWKPEWTKPLTSFQIMAPRELFNWTLDLGEPIKKHDPVLPGAEAPAPPATTPKGTRPMTSTPTSGSPPKQTGTPSNTGGDNGSTGLSQFLPQLKKVPEYQTLDSIIHEAIELWEKFKHSVQAIKDAVKAGAVAIKNAAVWVGEGVWDGLKWTGGKIAWVGGKIAEGAEAAWDAGGDALDYAGDKLGDLGGAIADLF